jgi:hypothetical protein
MLRDLNPGLSSRFDPKFAVELAIEFADSELLTIMAGEADKGNAVACKAARSETAGTTANIGKLWQFSSGEDVDGQGVDATKHAIARRQGGERWASQCQMWIPILTI